MRLKFIPISLLIGTLPVASLAAAEPVDPLAQEVQHLRQVCRSPQAQPIDWSQLGDAFMQQSLSTGG